MMLGDHCSEVLQFILRANDNINLLDLFDGQRFPSRLQSLNSLVYFFIFLLEIDIFFDQK